MDGVAWFGVRCLNHLTMNVDRPRANHQRPNAAKQSEHRTVLPALRAQQSRLSHQHDQGVLA